MLTAEQSFYYRKLKRRLNICNPLEAVAQRCSIEKGFLEISQNSQENTCARASFLIKLQASDGCF